MAGLPEWLGIETIDNEPGRLVCELSVREELLTPFGNLHGGVALAQGTVLIQAPRATN